jgi:uncharacterized phage protein (TIGR01671 family)
VSLNKFNRGRVSEEMIGLNTNIKFRAWDRQAGKFTDSGIQFNNSLMMLESVKPLVLMLCSNQRDREGNEIYDGDILVTSNDNPEFDLWDEKEYGVAMAQVNVESGFMIIDKCFMVWPHDEPNTIYSMKYLKVIGNIYENPELWNG